MGKRIAVLDVRHAAAIPAASRAPAVQSLEDRAKRMYEQHLGRRPRVERASLSFRRFSGSGSERA